MISQSRRGRDAFGGALIVCGLAAAVLAGVHGCVHVNADADVARANQLIEERTGVQSGVSAEPGNDAAGTELADGALTVERAVQIALRNNREFLALFEEIGVSRADVVQSGLLTNPSISLMARFPEGSGTPDIEFGIAQEIADLWQIPVKKKVARAQLEQTILRVAHRAVTLAADTKTRYYELMTARLAESTAQHSTELVQRSVDLAEAQMRGGEATRLDVNLQRVALLDANIESLSAQRNSRVAELELSRVLGLSRSNTHLRLAGQLPGIAPVPTAQELVTFAMEQRLDAQMAAFQVQEAEKSYKLEVLKIVPSLAVGFDVEQLEKRALPGRKILADTARASIANGGLTAPSIQSRGERGIERSQIIDAILGPSLTITVPLWDQNQAQIAKARFRVEQRRREFENLLDQVALEVERAAAQVRSAVELWRYYDTQAMPLAEETVQGARTVFQQGEQSILAFIEAQRSLVTRRAAAVEVKRAYAVAMTELEAAVGGRLPATPATQPADTQPANQVSMVGEGQ